MTKEFVVEEKKEAILLSEKAVKVRSKFMIENIFHKWDKLINN